MTKRYIKSYDGLYVQDWLILNRSVQGKHVAHVQFNAERGYAFVFTNEKQQESVNWLLNQAGYRVHIVCE